MQHASRQEKHDLVSIKLLSHFVNTPRKVKKCKKSIFRNYEQFVSNNPQIGRQVNALLSAEVPILPQKV